MSSRPKRRGAALVEAAIVLPVMIVLIGVAVDYSRIFYGNVTLNGASRNGGMYEFDPLNVSQSYYTDYANAGAADTTNLSSKVTYAKSSTTTSGVTNVTISATTSFKTMSSWFILPATKSVTKTLVIHKAPLVPDFP